MNTTICASDFSHLNDIEFMNIVLNTPEKLPPFIEQQIKDQWSSMLKMISEAHFNTYLETISDLEVRQKLLFFRKYFLKFQADEISKLKNNYHSIYINYMRQFHNKTFRPLRYFIYNNDLDLYFNQLCEETRDMGKDKTLPYPVSEIVIYPGNPHLYLKRMGDTDDTNIKMLYDYPIEWLLDANVDFESFSTPTTRRNNPAFGIFQNTDYFYEHRVFYTICKAYGKTRIYEIFEEKNRKETEECEDSDSDYDN